MSEVRNVELEIVEEKRNSERLREIAREMEK